MKLPFLSKKKGEKRPWQWPTCRKPKTFSFRANDDMTKQLTSIFLNLSDGAELSESCLTNSFKSPGFTTEESKGDAWEMITKSLHSDRLFFELGDTRSILKEEKSARFPFQETIMLAKESDDPYADFLRSMEEMVESHELKDWECLEELLGWYLRVNRKKNHGFIVGAFVDLLVKMASSSSPSPSFDSTTFSSLPSPLSPPGQKKKAAYEEDNMLMS